MIRRILVPLDPSDFTESAVRHACNIAKVSNAEVTGLVVLDIERIKSDIGPLPPGVSFYAKELQHNKLDAAKVHIANILSKFKAICKEERVRHAEGNRQGSPSKRILESSMFYDLVIMGMRTYYHFETEEHSGDSLENVLDRTVTPILAVPKHMGAFDVTDGKLRTLICFNGSFPSARALHRFLQLQIPAKVEATIAISHDNYEYANTMLDEAERLLNSHGISSVSKRSYSDNIISVLTPEYLSEFEVIVLGIHSNKGIFDFLVGSLAKHLLEESRVPLFLA